MKIEAFICDCCKGLKISDEVVGVSPVEDLFDRTKSYPVEYKNSKASIHLCTECYRVRVLIPAANSHNRAIDENGYNNTVKELSLNLRKSLVFQAFTTKKK